MEAAAFAFRFGLAFVFLSAGISKWVRPRREFAGAVANYRLIPEWMSRVVAAWLPAIEVALGVALVAGIGIVPAAWLAASLLFVFITALSINLIRRRSIECGCLGLSLPGRISWGLAVRNLLLLVMATFVGLQSPGSLVVWPAERTGVISSSWESFALVLAGALTIIGATVMGFAFRLAKAIRSISTLTVGAAP